MKRKSLLVMLGIVFVATAHVPAALPDSVRIDSGTVSKKLADTMSTNWANFARNGDPNGNGLPVWPAYKDKTTGGRAMILGGDTVEPEATPDAARLALYDTLYALQMTPAAGRTASR
jgi:carboxylesterase type B